eukprot:2614386-Rhodomonas_salina.4
MRKELAKLDCSDGQLEALEMIATAQKEGRPETCYLSFMSGKKERRAVKKLCKQHLPKISVKKHEEGGSQCLILRVGGGSAEEGPAKSGMIFPVRALCTMSEKGKSKSQDTAPPAGKAAPLAGVKNPVVFVKENAEKENTGRDDGDLDINVSAQPSSLSSLHTCSAQLSSL